MKSLSQRLSVILLLCFTSTTSPAEENPVSRKTLLSQNLPDIEQVCKVEVQEITMNKRITGIPHRHPCPVFGQILEGEIVFQIKGEKEVILRQGDSFYEPANTDILKFDNLGPEPTTFVAYYLISKDDDALVEMITQK